MTGQGGQLARDRERASAVHRTGLLNGQRVRVFVVADTRLSREGLCELLSTSESLGVVGADRCRIEVLDNRVVRSSDILLVDRASRDSLTLIGALSTRALGLKVLAYGLSDSLDDILAVAVAGASGYLLRDASLDELNIKVASLIKGGDPNSTSILASLGKDVTVTPHAALREGRSLSTREAEIAGYLMQGLMNKEIARRLGIELSTVKNHVHNILAKLRVRRRGEIERLSMHISG